MSTDIELEKKIRAAVDKLREEHGIERDELDRIASKAKCCWTEECYQTDVTRKRKLNVRKVGGAILKRNPHLFLPFMKVAAERSCRISKLNTLEPFFVKDGNNPCYYELSEDGLSVIKRWARHHKLVSTQGYVRLIEGLCPEQASEQGELFENRNTRHQHLTTVRLEASPSGNGNDLSTADVATYVFGMISSLNVLKLSTIDLAAVLPRSRLWIEERHRGQLHSECVSIAIADDPQKEGSITFRLSYADVWALREALELQRIL